MVSPYAPVQLADDHAVRVNAITAKKTRRLVGQMNVNILRFETAQATSGDSSQMVW
jgi:hypothetical protein